MSESQETSIAPQIPSTDGSLSPVEAAPEYSTAKQLLAANATVILPYVMERNSSIRQLSRNYIDVCRLAPRLYTAKDHLKELQELADDPKASKVPAPLIKKLQSKLTPFPYKKAKEYFSNYQEVHPKIILAQLTKVPNERLSTDSKIQSEIAQIYVDLNTKAEYSAFRASRNSLQSTERQLQALLLDQGTTKKKLSPQDRKAQLKDFKKVYEDVSTLDKMFPPSFKEIPNFGNQTEFEAMQRNGFFESRGEPAIDTEYVAETVVNRALLSAARNNSDNFQPTLTLPENAFSSKIYEPKQYSWTTDAVPPETSGQISPLTPEQHADFTTKDPIGAELSGQLVRLTAHLYNGNVRYQRSLQEHLQSLPEKEPQTAKDVVMDEPTVSTRSLIPDFHGFGMTHFACNTAKASWKPSFVQVASSASTVASETSKASARKRQQPTRSETDSAAAATNATETSATETSATETSATEDAFTQAAIPEVSVSTEAALFPRATAGFHQFFAQDSWDSSPQPIDVIFRTQATAGAETPRKSQTTARR